LITKIGYVEGLLIFYQGADRSVATTAKKLLDRLGQFAETYVHMFPLLLHAHAKYRTVFLQGSETNMVPVTHRSSGSRLALDRSEPGQTLLDNENVSIPVTHRSSASRAALERSQPGQLRSHL